MDSLTRKALLFNQYLKNAYRDEDDQVFYEKLELKEEDLTEDFTAILVGLHVYYKELIDEDCDLIDFIAILNKLAVQRVIGLKNEETD